VVKFQLNHLGSSKPRDNRHRGIDLAVVADKYAESTGSVEEQMVCEHYVFWRLGLCEIASADEE
jgi:hypothetical protein